MNCEPTNECCLRNMYQMALPLCKYLFYVLIGCCKVIFKQYVIDDVNEFNYDAFTIFTIDTTAYSHPFPVKPKKTKYKVNVNISLTTKCTDILYILVMILVP